MLQMQASHLSGMNPHLDNCYDSRGSLDDIASQIHQQQLSQCMPPLQPFPRMGLLSEAEEVELKILNEFCHLLEKSKQLFNGLR